MLNLFQSSNSHRLLIRLVNDDVITINIVLNVLFVVNTTCYELFYIVHKSMNKEYHTEKLSSC